MKYLSINELRRMPGLRIVLNPGLPGPWGEAVKNVAHVKGLSFLAGALERASENLPLKEWSAQTSAPVVAWNDERPRSGWNEQLFLFERLAPHPPLLPSAPEDRAILFGYINELAGENGLGWCRRLMMIHRMLAAPQTTEAQREFVMHAGRKYGYSPVAAEAAPSRCAAVLRLMSSRLQLQHARGSQFFIGTQLSALDIYWASFAAVVAPLPDDVCPMDSLFRQGYSAIGKFVEAALAPPLLAHRDFIYRNYLKLPMDFHDDGAAATKPSAAATKPRAEAASVTVSAGRSDQGRETKEDARQTPSPPREKSMTKVAVVVGVGPGLGLALARRFAQGGYAVGLMARSPENLKTVRDAVEKEGARAHAVVTDAGDAASIKSAFAEVRETLGAPEVLIYNAGAFQMGGILDLTPEKFEQCFKIHCLGALVASQQVLPDMVKQQRGTILFTGATASVRGGGKFAAVATGKFALRALGQSIAREFGPQGVHCAHVVIDGQIDTAAVRSMPMFASREAHTFLNPAALAETYWQLHVQPPTTWTLELDVRPAVEKF